MKILSVVVVLFFMGCAHAPPPPAKTGIETLLPGATGVIVPVTLSPAPDVLPSKTCRLDVRNTSTLKDFPVTLKAGVQNAFAEVPPGDYSFYDLYCGHDKTWDFSTKKWALIRVENEKISVAAPIEFRINSNGGMTTYFSNRNAVQNSMKKLFSALNPTTQNGVISAYTHKRITSKMTQPTQYQINVKLPPTHVNPAEPDEATYPDFKSCYTSEFPLNPLYVGYISMTAEYNNKVLVKSNLRENVSVYTEPFSNCVQAKLKEFVPNRSDNLVYDIVL